MSGWGEQGRRYHTENNADERLFMAEKLIALMYEAWANLDRATPR